MEESDYDKYSSWLSKFTDACQCDKWGQVVEATEAYQDIERTFTLRCEEGGAALWGRLRVRERENSRKLAMLIKLRIATMEQTHIEGPGIDDMDLLLDRFCAILSGLVIFPIPVEDYELDSNEVDRIARFESMTPIKKEIEVGNEVPGEGGIGGDKSSPNGRSSVGGVGGGGGVSSPQSQGRHVYAQSQTPLEERVKSSKYVYAATAVTNGGALKEPKEPTADSSYFSIEIEKVRESRREATARTEWFITHITNNLFIAAYLFAPLLLAPFLDWTKGCKHLWLHRPLLDNNSS